MPITPMIPGTGLIGWQVLQTTLDTQRTAFNKSSDLARDTEYFAEKIGTITSGDELVEDRRLLSVALSAFGLSDQIDSKYLIRRVLNEGTEDDSALANTLNDGRYVALANAFNFEETVDYPFQQEGFADDIVEAYKTNVRADLEDLLAQPEYANDPVASQVLREQTEVSLEITSDYFAEKIGDISSVDELLEDSDLLKVALGAFGADDRVNSKNVLRQVFEQGTDSPTALANILGDQKLIDMANAFGFDTEPTTAIQRENFADTIIDNHQWQLFEGAVSEVDEIIGTALSFQRAAPSLAALDTSDNTKWFNVLGDTMMREVFEKALGLPSGFSQIDIDKQLEVITEKAESRFGIESFADLEDEETLNKVIYSYLLQAEISANNSFGSQQIALTLLSNMGTQSAQA